MWLFDLGWTEHNRIEQKKKTAALYILLKVSFWQSGGYQLLTHFCKFISHVRHMSRYYKLVTVEHREYKYRLFSHAGRISALGLLSVSCTSRLRADILPVPPSRLVNKIYVFTCKWWVVGKPQALYPLPQRNAFTPKMYQMLSVHTILKTQQLPVTEKLKCTLEG